VKRVLAAVLLFACGMGSDRLVIRYRHPLKHTWDCQLVARPTEHSFWFMRPNRELFETYFDNPPIFQPGTQFKDITYTDDNADLRHFVKATVR
jgi:hypothetical protein